MACCVSPGSPLDATDRGGGYLYMEYSGLLSLCTWGKYGLPGDRCRRPAAAFHCIAACHCIVACRCIVVFHCIAACRCTVACRCIAACFWSGSSYCCNWFGSSTFSSFPAKWLVQFWKDGSGMQGMTEIISDAPGLAWHVSHGQRGI